MSQEDVEIIAQSSSQKAFEPFGRYGHDHESNMVFVGVLLAILAAAIGTTSKQLIAASSHLKKTWMFHLGAGMNIAFGPVVDASSYAFAPQVIIAPFACLDVIFNALTAPYTLHWQQERLTRVHLLGTACVFTGAVFTSLFANASNRIRDVYELEAQLFWRLESVLYLCIEAFAIVFVQLLHKRKLMNPKLRGISLGVVAGTLMGNVFFMKGLIGIIQTTASTGNFEAWWRLTPYLLAACAAGGAVYGHIVMRKGLGEYKGVFMVTIFEGAHITAACLSGCVVMEEMAGAPWWRYVLYWTAVVVIVCGMLAINLAAQDSQLKHEPTGSPSKNRNVHVPGYVDLDQQQCKDEPSHEGDDYSLVGCQVDAREKPCRIVLGHQQPNDEFDVEIDLKQRNVYSSNSNACLEMQPNEATPRKLNSKGAPSETLSGSLGDIAVSQGFTGMNGYIGS